MSAHAVRHDLEERGAVAVNEDLLLSLGRVDHGKRIVAVHALRVHLLGVEAGTRGVRGYRSPIVSP